MEPSISMTEPSLPTMEPSVSTMDKRLKRLESRVDELHTLIKDNDVKSLESAKGSYREKVRLHYCLHTMKWKSYDKKGKKRVDFSCPCDSEVEEYDSCTFTSESLKRHDQLLRCFPARPFRGRPNEKEFNFDKRGQSYETPIMMTRNWYWLKLSVDMVEILEMMGYEHGPSRAHLYPSTQTVMEGIKFWINLFKLRSEDREKTWRCYFDGEENSRKMEFYIFAKIISSHYDDRDMNDRSPKEVIIYQYDTEKSPKHHDGSMGLLYTCECYNIIKVHWIKAMYLCTHLEHDTHKIFCHTFEEKMITEIL